MQISVTGRLASLSSSTAYIAGGATLLILLIACLAAFHEGIMSMVHLWRQPHYSHGPVIPLLSALMFLREMKRDGGGPVTEWRLPGLGLVLLSVLAGYVSQTTATPLLGAYVIPIWVLGVIMVIFGWRRGLVFWPSVVHLGFMLPLPGLAFTEVSLVLQGISSEIGVMILRSFGVSVLLLGNVIDLGSYRLAVAEACSGLRYMFPILSFSYVFAILYTGPLWTKLIIFLSAVPVAIAMNSLRIAIIGLVVDSYGPAWAEGPQHLLEGWVIFVLCLAVLFTIAWMLKRLSGDQRNLVDALDLASDGLQEQLRRVRTLRIDAALGAALGLTLLTATAAALTVPAQATIYDRAPFAVFPTRVGDWRGFHVPMDPVVANILNADDTLKINYGHAEGGMVELFVAWHADEGGIHRPEICIPGGGFEVDAWTTHHFTINGEPLRTVRAVISRGSLRQVVHFWIQQDGVRYTNYYAAKVATVVEQIRSGSSDGALVRLITPLELGEDESAGDARVEQLLTEVLPRLRRHLPE